MKIRYLGPQPRVSVGPYGPHMRGEVKDYPDGFGEELLATSRRQRFEKVSGSAGADTPPDGAVLADMREIAERGGQEDFAWEGRPKPRVLEAVLGVDISAGTRDELWRRVVGERGE